MPTPSYLAGPFFLVLAGCHWCGRVVWRWHRHHGWLVEEMLEATETLDRMRDEQPTPENVKTAYYKCILMSAVGHEYAFPAVEKLELLAHTFGHMHDLTCDQVDDDITRTRVSLMERAMNEGKGFR